MNTIKKIIISIIMLLSSMISSAQLIHTQGQMGVGVRGGIGINGYNIGMIYNYQFNNTVALLVEVDREKAKFEYSKFTNSILFGSGVNLKIWNPTLWLFIHGSAAGNIGYDLWDCTVLDWKHENIVYGANGGIDLEAYPWHFLSFVLKARQWVLFGDGDSYAKPDFSLGIKYNW